MVEGETEGVDVCREGEMARGREKRGREEIEGKSEEEKREGRRR